MKLIEIKHKVTNYATQTITNTLPLSFKQHCVKGWKEQLSSMVWETLL
jgi:hypothetical protein